MALDVYLATRYGGLDAGFLCIVGLCGGFY